MRATIILGGVILCTCLAQAATPKMWVKDDNNRVPLRIDSIEADITITGGFAETMLKLRFRNETSRFQEGEFVMPLPEGATVSQYALEVNGSLRDGVAVEKKQARHAYETIKARKIDPGLVEREANNTYRTRVYPIPAKGTKLVSIGYIERIPLKDGKLHYTLPIDYPGTVDNFICRVHHSSKSADSIVVNATDLEFVKKEPKLTQATAKKKKLSGKISITLPQTKGTQVTLERHPDTNYFQLDLSLPKDVAEKPRTKPNHIHLIWDASASCRGRDVSKELDLLDTYFRHLGDTRVTLKLLRNKIRNAGEFTVRNGTWKKLRETINETYYDGSSAFHQIKPSVRHEQKPDLTILVTDGTSSEHIQLPSDRPTIVMHRADNNHLGRATHRGCGAAFNLTKIKSEIALRSLTHTRFRIKSIYSPTITAILPANYATNNQQSITGVTRGKFENSIQITYINGNGETIKQLIRPQHTTPGHTTMSIRRIWAQQKLLSLETETNNRDEIIKHCRAHSLVSNFTSLIVLERFSDYVEFKIPPPEPALRKTWQAAINKQLETKSIRRRSDAAWNAKVQWNRRNFSWLPHGLTAKYRQAEMWLDAVNATFEKQEIDQRTYAVIETWKDNTKRLVNAQTKILNGHQLKQWFGEHDKLIARWNSFKDLRSKTPPGKKTAISIRGLVHNPLTYRVEKPPTLREAIKLAGGLHPYGSYQRVSLYRNAHAATYNIASTRFRDITLQPADMVVVESEPYSEDGFGSDPFGEDSSSGSDTDITKLPPVAETNPGVQQGVGPADPFGGDVDGEPAARQQPKPKVDNTEIVSKQNSAARVAPSPITQADLKAFEAALKTAKDTEVSYRRIIGKIRRPMSDYISLARLLVKYKHSELAIQALSNIPEMSSMSPSSQRAYVYWLGEFKLRKTARAAMHSPGYPEDTQREFDQGRYAYQNEPSGKDIAEHYHSIATTITPATRSDYLILALTERNNRASSASPNNQKLTADIRCVIYSSNPDARLKFTVTEPMDHITSVHSPSHQGGRIYTMPGISEYMIKNAMPGEYKFTYTCSQPTTIQALIYRNFGTTQQSCQWITKLATPNRNSATMTTIQKEFAKQ